jgi:hypothetical protein
MKESTKRFTESLWETARRLKSRFAFAEIDGVLYESYITQLGVKRENFPVLFVLDYHNEKFYPPPPNINTLSVAGMERFLRMVDAGDIQAVSIGIWWSPLRLIRWFEKWLARFSVSTARSLVFSRALSPPSRVDTDVPAPRRIPNSWWARASSSL